jgi:hypothetical protein
VRHEGALRGVPEHAHHPTAAHVALEPVRELRPLAAGRLSERPEEAHARQLQPERERACWSN